MHRTERVVGMLGRRRPGRQGRLIRVSWPLNPAPAPLLLASGAPARAQGRAVDEAGLRSAHGPRREWGEQGGKRPACPRCSRYVNTDCWGPWSTCAHGHAGGGHGIHSEGHWGSTVTRWQAGKMKGCCAAAHGFCGCPGSTRCSRSAASCSKGVEVAAHSQVVRWSTLDRSVPRTVTLVEAKRKAARAVAGRPGLLRCAPENLHCPGVALTRSQKAADQRLQRQRSTRGGNACACLAMLFSTIVVFCDTPEQSLHTPCWLLCLPSTKCMACLSHALTLSSTFCIIGHEHTRQQEATLGCGQQEAGTY
jgi:hypothetical protein